MAATQTAAVYMKVSASSTSGGRTGAAAMELNRRLASGTTADQADKTYYAERTVTNNATPDTMDLAAGGLIDLNGDVFSPAEVTTLAIWNTDTTNTLTVGGGSNAFNWGNSGSGTKTLLPGEMAILANAAVDPGYTVTAGTGDILKVTTSGGTNVPYSILIIGRSA